jgi:hypothetical protein
MRRMVMAAAAVSLVAAAAGCSDDSGDASSAESSQWWSVTEDIYMDDLKDDYPGFEHEQVYKLIDAGREVCNHYAQLGGDYTALTEYMATQYFYPGEADAAGPTMAAALKDLCPTSKPSGWSDGGFQ